MPLTGSNRRVAFIPGQSRTTEGGDAPRPADRLELIGGLWDSLSPDDLPVTDAERAMIDDRLVDLTDNPADARL